MNKDLKLPEESIRVKRKCNTFMVTYDGLTGSRGLFLLFNFAITIFMINPFRKSLMWIITFLVSSFLLKYNSKKAISFFKRNEKGLVWYAVGFCWLIWILSLYTILVRIHLLNIIPVDVCLKKENYLAAVLGVIGVTYLTIPQDSVISKLSTKISLMNPSCENDVGNHIAPRVSSEAEEKFWVRKKRNKR